MIQRTARKSSTWATNAEENYQHFLTLLGKRTAAAIERHAELCEADAAQGYGRTWKRLAGMLAALAPAAIESVGHQTLKFHIPDGKYRQQVFALHDTGEGRLDLFMPEISALVVTRKILTKPPADSHTYGIVGEREDVELHTVTSDDKECPPFCRPMLGWGRKALRVSINSVPEETRIVAVERLCELAAEAWKDRIAAELPAGSEAVRAFRSP